MASYQIKNPNHELVEKVRAFIAQGLKTQEACEKAKVGLSTYFANARAVDKQNGGRRNARTVEGEKKIIDDIDALIAQGYTKTAAAVKLGYEKGRYFHAKRWLEKKVSGTLPARKMLTQEERQKLVSDVESMVSSEGISIAVACRKLGLSPSSYHHNKGFLKTGHWPANASYTPPSGKKYRGKGKRTTTIRAIRHERITPDFIQNLAQQPSSTSPAMVLKVEGLTIEGDLKSLAKFIKGLGE